MKWIGFVVVLALVIAVCYYAGLLKEIAGPFKAWLRWIGAQ
jgi:hypothetical protein